MNTATYKSSDMRRALCLGGLLSMLCVMPLWADPDIANNVTTPSCDDSVLQSDTGPVNIEIDWVPNHITLNWYEDSSATTPMNVGTASQSCDYDGTLTVPAAPAARTGYTFRGWKVRRPAPFDLTTLTDVGFDWRNYDGAWGRGYKNGADKCVFSTRMDDQETENCSNSNYADLNRNEWKFPLSNGAMLYGEASCNNVQGTSRFNGNVCYE